MPLYTYKNNETGEEWEEMRPMSEMLDGVDGVKIVQLLSKPASLMAGHAEASQKLAKFQKDTLGPICEKWRPDGTNSMTI